MGVKIGIWVPSYAWDVASEKEHQERLRRLRVYIERCEELDFDVWVIDHLLTAPGLYGNSWLEPLEVLSYAAALTERVQLGTGILVLPVRHPVMLAKEVATVMHLSAERYIFGIGPGWYPKEFEATGTDISERGRRTDEILGAVKRLLSEEDVTFEGEFYRFEGVTIEPRPRRMPEIWVSGGSRVPDPEYHDVAEIAPSVLRRIANADAWLSRCSGTQEFLLRDWEKVKAYLGEVGRDVSSLRFAHCNFIQMTPGLSREQALEEQREHAIRAFGTHRTYEHLQECYLLGEVDHQVGRLKELAEHGMDYVVLGPLSDDPEQLDMIDEHINKELNR
jgi:probable F420-dependent oxidoreductase